MIKMVWSYLEMVFFRWSLGGEGYRVDSWLTDSRFTESRRKTVRSPHNKHGGMKWLTGDVLQGGRKRQLPANIIVCKQALSPKSALLCFISHFSDDVLVVMLSCYCPSSQFINVGDKQVRDRKYRISLEFFSWLLVVGKWMDSPCLPLT